jgi:hypothetical protein
MIVRMATVVTTLFIVSLVAKADQDRVEEFKGRLAEKIEFALLDDPRDLLVASGLSETDAARVFEQLGVDAASCIVDALLLQAAEQSISTDALIDQAEKVFFGNTGEDFVDLMHGFGYEDKLEPCTYEAIQRAGIQVE